MTVEILDVLAQLEAGLKRIGRHEVLNHLQAGMQVTEFKALLGDVGLTPCEGLEQLYLWRNGTRSSTALLIDNIQLFPGFHMLSAEDSILDYLAFRDDYRWSRGWLPILANGGGDFYFVDLNDDRRGAVGHFRIDEQEHPTEFESVASMLLTMVSAIDLGAFYSDASGYFEIDDVAFSEIAAKNNPGVDWWTSPLD